MSYQIPSRNDLSEHSLQNLAEMWGREEIGPRTLVRNSETGEDLYLDQVIDHPAVPIFAPQSSTKPRLRGWIVGLIVMVACLGILCFAGFQAYKIQQKEVEVIKAEARELLVLDRKVMMEYIRQNNGKFPPSMYDLTPLMKIKVNGQTYVDFGSKGTHFTPNEQLAGKKLSQIKDPAHTVLFTSMNNNLISSMPVITLDGTIYELDYSTTFSMETIPADAKPWKPQP